MIIISPTGKGIRSDSWGDGHYGSNRSINGRHYIHKGSDHLCKIGQPVYAPITAIYKRIALPYANTQEYTGGMFQSDWCQYKMFYFLPTIEIGTKVEQGQVVGIAQCISDYYGLDSNGNAMEDHVHLEIGPVDPAFINKISQEMICHCESCKTN